MIYIKNIHKYTTFNTTRRRLTKNDCWMCLPPRQYCIFTVSPFHEPLAAMLVFWNSSTSTTSMKDVETCMRKSQAAEQFGLFHKLFLLVFVSVFQVFSRKRNSHQAMLVCLMADICYLSDRRLFQYFCMEVVLFLQVNNASLLQEEINSQCY